LPEMFRTFWSSLYCSRRRPFRSFCFADYQLSHVHFAPGFHKLPIRTFAFRISQITNGLSNPIHNRRGLAIAAPSYSGPSHSLAISRVLCVS